ncbi:MAG: hypothetical protein C4334_00435 [Pyrinomonas sp.]
MPVYNFSPPETQRIYAPTSMKAPTSPNKHRAKAPHAAENGIGNPIMRLPMNGEQTTAAAFDQQSLEMI